MWDVALSTPLDTMTLFLSPFSGAPPARVPFPSQESPLLFDHRTHHFDPPSALRYATGAIRAPLSFNGFASFFGNFADRSRVFPSCCSVITLIRRARVRLTPCGQNLLSPRPDFAGPPRTFPFLRRTSLRFSLIVASFPVLYSVQHCSAE